MVGAMLSKCGDAVEEWTSEQHEIGAQRTGAKHIETASDAAVQKDRRSVADSIRDLRQGVDAGRRRIAAASSVIGDQNAVGADIDNSNGIFRMQNAFDNQLTLPAIPDCLDLVQTDAPPELAADKVGGFLKGRAIRNISCHIVELWNAVAENFE